MVHPTIKNRVKTLSEFWKDETNVQFHYKMEHCTDPGCHKDFTCPKWHNWADKRRPGEKFHARGCNHAWLKRTWVDSKGRARTGLWVDPTERCPHGDVCPLAHSPAERQYHSSTYKSEICRDYEISPDRCVRSIFCAYVHFPKGPSTRVKAPVVSKPTAEIRPIVKVPIPTRPIGSSGSYAAVARGWTKVQLAQQQFAAVIGIPTVSIPRGPPRPLMTLGKKTAGIPKIDTVAAVPTPSPSSTTAYSDSEEERETVVLQDLEEVTVEWQQMSTKRPSGDPWRRSSSSDGSPWSSSSSDTTSERIQTYGPFLTGETYTEGDSAYRYTQDWYEENVQLPAYGRVQERTESMLPYWVNGFRNHQQYMTGPRTQWFVGTTQQQPCSDYTDRQEPPVQSEVAGTIELTAEPLYQDISSDSDSLAQWQAGYNHGQLYYTNARR